MASQYYFAILKYNDLNSIFETKQGVIPKDIVCDVAALIAHTTNIACKSIYFATQARTE